MKKHSILHDLKSVFILAKERNKKKYDFIKNIETELIVGFNCCTEKDEIHFIKNKT